MDYVWVITGTTLSTRNWGCSGGQTRGSKIYTQHSTSALQCLCIHEILPEVFQSIQSQHYHLKLVSISNEVRRNSPRRGNYRYYFEHQKLGSDQLLKPLGGAVRYTHSTPIMSTCATTVLCIHEILPEVSQSIQSQHHHLNLVSISNEVRRNPPRVINLP